jgi:hypothetical protein
LFLKQCIFYSHLSFQWRCNTSEVWRKPALHAEIGNIISSTLWGNRTVKVVNLVHYMKNKITKGFCMFVLGFSSGEIWTLMFRALTKEPVNKHWTNQSLLSHLLLFHLCQTKPSLSWQPDHQLTVVLMQDCNSVGLFFPLSVIPVYISNKKDDNHRNLTLSFAIKGGLLNVTIFYHQLQCARQKLAEDANRILLKIMTAYWDKWNNKHWSNQSILSRLLQFSACAKLNRPSHDSLTIS